MPIYEYECIRCQHRFEVIQKFSDPPKRNCPRCRKRVRRLISVPGIQFKGTGWYVTDYARKGSSSEEAGKSDSSSSKTESSGDSKPASTGDSKPASTGHSSRPPARRRVPRRAASSRRRRR
ncbi:MAG: FmdB family zinc ribbon protein [Acidobacteriota bacterium]